MEAICICVYIAKLPPNTLPLWRRFGWRQCDLKPQCFVIHLGLKNWEMFFFLHFSKLLVLLLNVTKVITGHQNWPKTGQNSTIRFLCARRPKPFAGYQDYVTMTMWGWKSFGFETKLLDAKNDATKKLNKKIL